MKLQNDEQIQKLEALRIKSKSLTNQFDSTVKRIKKSLGFHILAFMLVVYINFFMLDISYNVCLWVTVMMGLACAGNFYALSKEDIAKYFLIEEKIADLEISWAEFKNDYQKM